jgi:hypothetical protein
MEDVARAIGILLVKTKRGVPSVPSSRHNAASTVTAPFLLDEKWRPLCSPPVGKMPRTQLPDSFSVGSNMGKALKDF